MNAKRKGSGRISKTDAMPQRSRVARKADPGADASDDTPEITDRWVAEADLMQGPVLVRRGRPPAADPKRLLSLRIPATVIARWKASGPGWQTRMAATLAKAAPRRAPNR
jgi:uncharacterized protein (DUF4415 family)